MSPATGLLDADVTAFEAAARLAVLPEMQGRPTMTKFGGPEDSQCDWRDVWLAPHPGFEALSAAQLPAREPTTSRGSQAGQTR